MLHRTIVAMCREDEPGLNSKSPLKLPGKTVQRNLFSDSFAGAAHILWDSFSFFPLITLRGETVKRGILVAYELLCCNGWLFLLEVYVQSNSAL